MLMGYLKLHCVSIESPVPVAARSKA